MNILQLRGTDARMAVRAFIPRDPPDDPNCTEEARGQKGCAPTEFYGDPWDQSGRKYRADIRPGIENAGDERAFSLREPFRGRLDRGREAAGFAKSKKKASNSEAERGRSQRVPHRCDTPEPHDNDVADARAESINEAPGEDESDCVGELKSADDIAVLRFGPTDGVLECGREETEDLAIQIINRCGKE